MCQMYNWYEYSRIIFRLDSNEHEPLTMRNGVAWGRLCEVICLNPVIESNISVPSKAFTIEIVAAMMYDWTD